ncbi:hypothetical protein EmuJ_000484600 [Echinococcus multilocularis]|uniref:Uncharacterized protein n=1 Tax=Echinococcus multilocularis TaxID=6211 RepID=A0A068Y5Z1_ECHMU|nr:hypothetical protein EmuJ_000484600 [Echinococcus multilocularis]
MAICPLKEQCLAPTEPTSSPRCRGITERLVSSVENTPGTIILNITLGATHSECSNRIKYSCVCSSNPEGLESTSQKEAESYKEDVSEPCSLEAGLEGSLRSPDPVNCSCLENSPRKHLRIRRRRSASCCLDTAPKNPQCSSMPPETMSKTPDCLTTHIAGPCLPNETNEPSYNSKSTPEPSCSEKVPREPQFGSKPIGGPFCPEDKAQEPVFNSKYISVMCPLEKTPREPTQSSKLTQGSVYQENALRSSRPTSKCSVKAQIKNECKGSQRLENAPKKNRGLCCQEKGTQKCHCSSKSTTDSCCSGISAKGSLPFSNHPKALEESQGRSKRLAGPCCRRGAPKESMCSSKYVELLSFKGGPKEFEQNCKNKGTLSLRSTPKASTPCLNCTKEPCQENVSKKSVCGSRPIQACCLGDATQKSVCSFKHTTKPFCVGITPQLSSSTPKHATGTCCFGNVPQESKCFQNASQGSVYGCMTKTAVCCSEHSLMWSTRTRKSTEGPALENKPRNCGCSSKQTEVLRCQENLPEEATQSCKQLEQNCIRITPRCAMRRYGQTTGNRFVKKSPKPMQSSKYTVETSCSDDFCKEFLCDPEPLTDYICPENVSTKTPYNPISQLESSYRERESRRSDRCSAQNLESSCMEGTSNEAADGSCSPSLSNASICQIKKPVRGKRIQLSCGESKSVKCGQRTRRDPLDPEMQSKIDSLIQQRETMGSRSIKSKSVDKVYQALDAVIECQAVKSGLTPTPSLYCPSTSYPSRYSMTYNDTGETPMQRSFKITPAAREDIKKLHELLSTFFDKLLGALDALNKCDFSFCNEMVCLICRIQKTITQLIENLRYGTYKDELDDINKRLLLMLDELLTHPHYVLLRLVEFGFNIYELGGHLREELLPYSFAQIVHKVQSRIYRLQTGRIIRQIYFVPDSMDPVIGTYFKSRRLMKLEHFCHCSVVLLPPDDPRSIYCPMHYRTIEVNFDSKKGRYVGFQQLLNQCAPDKGILPRLVASVYKRLSGAEVEISLKDLCELETTEARISYDTIRGDMASGNGLAVAPKIEI